MTKNGHFGDPGFWPKTSRVAAKPFQNPPKNYQKRSFGVLRPNPQNLSLAITAFFKQTFNSANLRTLSAHLEENRTII